MPKNSNISYDEFLERVDKYHAQFQGDWKYGQTYFNILSSLRRDLAEQIRGTLHDPFHKDEVGAATHKLVRSMW